MLYVAVFFVYITGQQPVALQSLQAFKDRGACVAYVRPLLAQVAGASSIQVKAYCPTSAAADAGNYGEPVK